MLTQRLIRERLSYPTEELSSEQCWLLHTLECRPDYSWKPYKRQTGKTSLALTYLFTLCEFFPKTNVYYSSFRYAQTRDAVVRNLAKFESSVDKLSRDCVQFKNGSKLFYDKKDARAEGFRGLSYDYIVLDDTDLYEHLDELLEQAQLASSCVVNIQNC